MSEDTGDRPLVTWLSLRAKEGIECAAALIANEPQSCARLALYSSSQRMPDPGHDRTIWHHSRIARLHWPEERGRSTLHHHLKEVLYPMDLPPPSVRGLPTKCQSAYIG